MSDTLNALQAANRSSSVLGAIANPMTVNPLAAMTSAAQTANAIYNVREQQGQQLWGQALQQATDENGNVDFAKAQGIAAQMGPAAAMVAAKNLANTASIRGQQINNAAGIYKMTGIAALNVAKDPTDAGVNSAFDNLIASGLPASEVNAERQRVLDMKDPVQRQNYAVQHGLSVLDALHQTVGQTTLQNFGNVVAPATVYQPTPNAPGSVKVTPGIPLGLTPDQLAQPHDYVDANGVTQHTTVGEYLKTLGVQLPGGQPPGGQPPGGQPSVAPIVPQPQSAQTQPPTGRSISGPQPGMAEKWKASAEQYNADNLAAGSYQQRIFPLVQAASILKSGDVTTGQGAEAFNRVKSFLMTQAANLGVDAQTIGQADFDKVGKYLQQYVNQQGMSGRSDQALASAVSGNPSAHISTLANQQILPAMIGMERMRQMIISDFRAQGGQPNQYSDYAANWQNTHDPRAFVFDMMDQSQRQKMLAGMTNSQKQAFARTLDIVERNPGIMGQAVMPGQ